MTKRERVLASSLAGVLTLCGAGLLFQVAFLGPLRQLREEEAATRKDLEDKQKELKAGQETIDRAVKLSPRLALWKQLSLPVSKEERPEEVNRHLAALQVEYERYLSDLLRRNGFAPGTIAVTSKPVEAPRAASAAAKGPPPVFRALTFTARGSAALDGVAKMLEEFHRASLLQQVRSFNVQKPSQDKPGSRGLLDVTMTADVLLVNGARKGDPVMPASPAVKPQVLAEPGRTYAALAAHNVFTGTPPAAPAATQSEDARDVLGFVKLTTVSNNNGRRWEAWLYDQAKKDGESRVRTSAGFNEFSYADRYDNVLVRGTVVVIDETGVLFKANGRFHHIGVGQTLFEALREAEPMPAAGAAVGAAWAAPW
jgi:hypothetical protein